MAKSRPVGQRLYWMKLSYFKLHDILLFLYNFYRYLMLDLHCIELLM